jgi:hypothetical protein
MVPIYPRRNPRPSTPLSGAGEHQAPASVQAQAPGRTKASMTARPDDPERRDRHKMLGCRPSAKAAGSRKRL